MPSFTVGHSHSYTSIDLTFDGRQFTDVKSVSFGHGREPSYGYSLGNGGVPTARTQGLYTPSEVAVTMRLPAYQQLCAALAARAPDGRYGSSEFEISVNHVALDGPPITVQISRCRIVSDNFSQDTSSDESLIDFTVNAMLITRDGLKL